MGLLVAGDNAPGYKTVDRSFFTATAGQTIFTITQGYQVGDIDVYLNGIRLVDSEDYYATNGLTVVLISGANLGDSLAVIAYTQFNVAGSYTKNESDNRYLSVTGVGSMTGYLKTPNYGVSSYSDSANASLEANVGLGTQGTSVKVWGRNVASSGGDVHYVADTRGAGGGHRFYGWNGTTLTNFMSVSSSGLVTKPNQPMFAAYGSSSGVTNSGTALTIPYNNIDTNIGNCYNGTTYRFTAPVSGVYYFSASFLNYPNASTGYCTFWLSKNGNSYTNSQPMARGPLVTQQTIQFDGVIYLSANDWVDARTDLNGTYYNMGGHAHFTGYFLG